MLSVKVLVFLIDVLHLITDRNFIFLFENYRRQYYEDFENSNVLKNVCE